MDKRTAQLELKQADLSYKLNSGQTGFYRVKYADAKNQERLLQYVSQKKLGIEDRWGIQMDLFAQILCGNASMSDYLSMLSHYSDEDAYLPLVSIVDHLFLAYRILDSRWRASISAAGRSLIERILQRIGWEPAEGEPHTTALLRDHILWPGGGATSWRWRNASAGPRRGGAIPTTRPIFAALSLVSRDRSETG